MPDTTTSPDALLYIRCPNCDANNRIPRAKLAQGLSPVCGRCKQPLPLDLPSDTAPVTTPITVTDATFDAEVIRSPIPVLLDLWAPWCGPCRALAPTLDQLAAEMAGRVRVAKINIDENPATAARFNVRSIPTLLVIKGGKEADRIVGVQPKPVIAKRLEALAP